MSSLLRSLHSRVATTPDRVAYRFLDDPESDGAILSYAELDRRARILADRLRGETRPGDRVLLLFPNGLEFVVALFACFTASRVAVPAPAPIPGRERRSLPRLVAIATDARPSLILTDAATRPAIDIVLSEAAAETAELGRLKVLASDEIEGAEGESSAERAGAPSSDQPAYLQYTSGSTAAPKGVVVSHRALARNSEAIRKAWGYEPDSRSVMWVPNFHDDGLVHGIVQPLHTGFEAVLMSPADLVLRPILWLRAIDRFAATHSGGPNFAYELAVSRTDPADRDGLDLSRWRVAYNAAEPVRSGTLRRFHDAYRAHGLQWETLRPSFGLAEATLLVTTGLDELGPRSVQADPGVLEREQRLEIAAREDGGRPLVGCGRAVAGTRVVVVDPESRLLLPDGRVGEIWVASDGLAEGYWENEEASAESFRAYLAGSGDGPFLRTGDLGLLQDGELYVTGRLKDLIILHGRNIYPQDIERTVEICDSGVRAGCVAAFALDGGGDERLAIVAEVTRTADRFDAMVEAIRIAVAEEHELPVSTVALIRTGTLPKTSSGKVQRSLARDSLANEELDLVRTWRAELPGGGLALSSAGTRDDRAGDVEQVEDWLRRFAAERFDAALADERRSLPPLAVLELGNHGLLGLQVPRRWGGMGLGHVDALRLYRQLGAIDLSLASLVSAHNTLGVLPLLEHGPDALRGELLPVLSSGRRLGAFALTERSAGSNPRAAEAYAEPVGEGRWRLHGEKVWSGSATWAGALTVFVRASEGGGFSAFVLRPGQTGLHLGPEMPTLGLRGMAQCIIRLDGVEVDRAALLGRVGDGLEVAQGALSAARLALGAICTGGLQRCVQLAARFAARRSVAGGRLIDHPVTRRRLADMISAAAALQSLVGLVARRLDAGADEVGEVFVAVKVAGSELLWWAADLLVQTLGGRGYADNGPAARILRDSRAFRIVEGPTEALAAFLGARLHQDRDALAGILGEGAPALQFRAAVDDLIEAPGAQGVSVSDTLRWKYHEIGLLAVDGLLWAAAEHERSDRDSDPAVGWAAGRFAAARSGLVVPTAEPSASWAGRWLEGQIADLDTAIGTGGTARIGEDWSAEPLLRPELEVKPGADPSQRRVTVRQAATSARSGRTARVGLDNGSAETIASWLRSWVGDHQGLEPDTVEMDRPFEYHGLDSVSAVTMLAELSDALGRQLAPTDVFAHPSIDALSRHVAGSMVSAAEPRDPAPSKRHEQAQS